MFTFKGYIVLQFLNNYCDFMFSKLVYVSLILMLNVRIIIVILTTLITRQMFIQNQLMMEKYVSFINVGSYIGF